MASTLAPSSGSATSRLRVAREAVAGAEWDDFVRTQPGWTHFHLSGWKHVIEECFGHECLYLAARRDDGQLEGVLPLVRVRSALFGHYLVSVPFVNYGGPLGEPGAVRRLAEEAARVAERDGARLLELRSRSPLDIDLAVTHRKVTVVLDLPADAATLWTALGSKLRSQVRRASKEGGAVRFGADQIGPFHDVFARNMRDLGTPVLPRRFFERIAERFPDSAHFGCVYIGGIACAAGCALSWGAESEMTWASSLRSHQRSAPNMLLYWSFLERAIEAGATAFNFGRCTPGGGTHRFKQQWGGRDQALWWYYQSADGTLATPSPEAGRMYDWATRVWSRLPLGITNRLGPRLVRYIP